MLCKEGGYRGRAVLTPLSRHTKIFKVERPCLVLLENNVNIREFSFQKTHQLLTHLEDIALIEFHPARKIKGQYYQRRVYAKIRVATLTGYYWQLLLIHYRTVDL